MENTGTIIKFSKRKKYGTILPDQWKTLRQDVYFETIDFDFSEGDRVEYTYIEKKGRRFAEEIKKIG
jgi:cold shock CspA family protein